MLDRKINIPFPLLDDKKSYANSLLISKMMEALYFESPQFLYNPSQFANNIFSELGEKVASEREKLIEDIYTNYISMYEHTFDLMTVDSDGLEKKVAAWIESRNPKKAEDPEGDEKTKGEGIGEGVKNNLQNILLLYVTAKDSKKKDDDKGKAEEDEVLAVKETAKPKWYLAVRDLDGKIKKDYLDKFNELNPVATKLLKLSYNDLKKSIKKNKNIIYEILFNLNKAKIDESMHQPLVTMKADEDNKYPLGQYFSEMSVKCKTFSADSASEYENIINILNTLSDQPLDELGKTLTSNIAIPTKDNIIFMLEKLSSYLIDNLTTLALQSWVQHRSTNDDLPLALKAWEEEYIAYYCANKSLFVFGAYLTLISLYGTNDPRYSNQLTFYERISSQLDTAFEKSIPQDIKILLGIRYGSKVLFNEEKSLFFILRDDAHYYQYDKNKLDSKEPFELAKRWPGLEKQLKDHTISAAYQTSTDAPTVFVLDDAKSAVTYLKKQERGPYSAKDYPKLELFSLLESYWIETKETLGKIVGFVTHKNTTYLFTEKNFVLTKQKGGDTYLSEPIKTRFPHYDISDEIKFVCSNNNGESIYFITEDGMSRIYDVENNQWINKKTSMYSLFSNELNIIKHNSYQYLLSPHKATSQLENLQFDNAKFVLPYRAYNTNHLLIMREAYGRKALSSVVLDDVVGDIYLNVLESEPGKFIKEYDPSCVRSAMIVNVSGRAYLAFIHVEKKVRCEKLSFQLWQLPNRENDVLTQVYSRDLKKYCDHFFNLSSGTTLEFLFVHENDVTSIALDNELKELPENKSPFYSGVPSPFHQGKLKTFEFNSDRYCLVINENIKDKPFIVYMMNGELQFESEFKNKNYQDVMVSIQDNRVLVVCLCDDNISLDVWGIIDQSAKQELPIIQRLQENFKPGWDMGKAKKQDSDDNDNNNNNEGDDKNDTWAINIASSFLFNLKGKLYLSLNGKKGENELSQISYVYNLHSSGEIFDRVSTYAGGALLEIIENNTPIKIALDPSSLNLTDTLNLTSSGMKAQLCPIVFDKNIVSDHDVVLTKVTDNGIAHAPIYHHAPILNFSWIMTQQFKGSLYTFFYAKESGCLQIDVLNAEAESKTVYNNPRFTSGYQYVCGYPVQSNDELFLIMHYKEMNRLHVYKFDVKSNVLNMVAINHLPAEQGDQPLQFFPYSENNKTWLVMHYLRDGKPVIERLVMCADGTFIEDKSVENKELVDFEIDIYYRVFKPFTINDQRILVCYQNEIEEIEKEEEGKKIKVEVKKICFYKLTELGLVALNQNDKTPELPVMTAPRDRFPNKILTPVLYPLVSGDTVQFVISNITDHWTYLPIILISFQLSDNNMVFIEKGDIKKNIMFFGNVQGNDGHNNAIAYINAFVENSDSYICLTRSDRQQSDLYKLKDDQSLEWMSTYDHAVTARQTCHLASGEYQYSMPLSNDQLNEQTDLLLRVNPIPTAYLKTTKQYLQSYEETISFNMKIPAKKLISVDNRLSDKIIVLPDHYGNDHLAEDKGYIIRLTKIDPILAADYKNYKGNIKHSMVYKLNALGYSSAYQIASADKDDYLKKTHAIFRNGKDAYNVYLEAKAISKRITFAYLNYMQTASPYVKNSRIQHHITTDQSFDEIFGGQNYFAYDKSNTMYSPAAYFYDLMRIVEGYMVCNNDDFSLKTRRPDLFSVPLDSQHTFTEIVYLKLVNYILSSRLTNANYNENGDFDKHIKSVVEKAFSYDELANESKYTTLFRAPFILPMEKIRLLLKENKICLSDVGLARELKSIPTLVSKDIQDTSSAFNTMLAYIEVSPIERMWLKKVHDGETFKNRSIEDEVINNQAKLDDVCRISGLDRQTLVAFIDYSHSHPTYANNTKEVSLAISIDYEMKSERLSNLTDDKIHRLSIIKYLSDKTGLTFNETDHLMAACFSNDNNFELEIFNFARLVWLYKNKIQDLNVIYGLFNLISVQELSKIFEKLTDIKPENYAKKNDELVNLLQESYIGIESDSALGADSKIVDKDLTGEKEHIAKVVNQLCASLQINELDLSILIAESRKEIAGKTTFFMQASHDSIDYLLISYYRVTQLAKIVKLSVFDLCTLFHYTNDTQESIFSVIGFDINADVLFNLCDAADYVHSQNINMATLFIAVYGNISPYQDAQLNNFMPGLRQSVVQLKSQYKSEKSAESSNILDGAMVHTWNKKFENLVSKYYRIPPNKVDVFAKLLIAPPESEVFFSAYFDEDTFKKALEDETDINNNIHLLVLMTKDEWVIKHTSQDEMIVDKITDKNVIHDIKSVLGGTIPDDLQKAIESIAEQKAKVEKGEQVDLSKLALLSDADDPKEKIDALLQQFKDAKDPSELFQCSIAILTFKKLEQSANDLLKAVNKSTEGNELKSPVETLRDEVDWLFKEVNEQKVKPLPLVDNKYKKALSLVKENLNYDYFNFVVRLDAAKQDDSLLFIDAISRLSMLLSTLKIEDLEAGNSHALRLFKDLLSDKDKKDNNDNNDSNDNVSLFELFKSPSSKAVLPYDHLKMLMFLSSFKAKHKDINSLLYDYIYDQVEGDSKETTPVAKQFLQKIKWSRADIIQIFNLRPDKKDEITLEDVINNLEAVERFYSLKSCLHLEVKDIALFLNLFESSAKPQKYFEIADNLSYTIQHAVEKNKKSASADDTNPLDKIYEQQRDILVDVILDQVHQSVPEVDTVDKLSEYFLIDLQMTSVFTTSYMTQAIASVQMYMQRSRLNLEKSVDLRVPDKWWAWAERYRIWEANRKIFLHPENFIEPDLRTEKSPEFDAFTQALQQSVLNKDSINNAYRSYFDKMVLFSKLKYCDAFISAGEKTELGEPKVMTIFAHTSSQPYEHYYRQISFYNDISTASWNYWEKINVKVPVPIVTGTVFNNRLFFFWVESKLQKTSPAPAPGVSEKLTDFTQPKTTYLDYTISYSYQNSDLSWAHPQVLIKDRFGGLDLQLASVEYKNNMLLIKDNPSDSLYANQVNVSLGGNSNELVITYSLGNIHLLVEKDKDDKDKTKQVRSYRLDSSLVMKPAEKPQAIPIKMNLFSYINDKTPHYLSYDAAKSPKFSLSKDNGNLTQKLQSSTDLVNIRNINVKNLPSDYAIVNTGVESYLITKDGARYPDNQPHFNFTRIASTLAIKKFSEMLILKNISDVFDIINLSCAHTIKDIANPNNKNITGPADGKLDFSGGMSNYFWEAFFFVPFYVANSLNLAGQFDEARLWLSYVFDPINVGGTVGKGASIDKTQSNQKLNPIAIHTRDFKFPIFRTIDPLSTYDALTNERLFEVYHDHAFDPHSLAKLRPVIYMKVIVMRYIKNLIDWGDQLFTADTREDITLASTLYIMANDLLGKKPQAIGEAPESTSMTLNKFKSGHVVLNKQEMGVIDYLESIAQNNNGSHSNDIIKHVPMLEFSPYFSIPENDEFIAYWDRVADRLFKIRHSLNIKGVKQHLDLFAPEIDPHQLVRAAASQGGLNILSMLQQTAPIYRFSALIQYAQMFTNNVIQLGQSILSTLEKQDAEALSDLRLKQQDQSLQLLTNTLNRQIDSLNEEKALVDKNIEHAQYRQQYYGDLIKENISTLERVTIGLRAGALVFRALSGVSSTASAIGYAVPQVGSPFAMTYGGEQIGAVLTAIASDFNILSDATAFGADTTQTFAQYERRKEEWEYQKQLATNDIDSLTQQQKINDVHLQIAQLQLSNHERSIEQNQAIIEYYQSKFTNIELYRWISSQLQGFHQQMFNMALTVARSAECAYHNELNTDKTIISTNRYAFNYKGLTSGEALMVDIHNLQKTYIDGHERLLEIEKNISLKELLGKEKWDPAKLKGDGILITLDQELFAEDFPNLINKKIKMVSVTVPALSAPYQSLNLVLTQLTSRVQKKSGGEKDEGVSMPIKQEQIVISKGLNDTGLFSASMNDERYLPFEGTGVISTWNLKFANKNTKFDASSISDVIITIRYTAQQSMQLNLN